MKKIILEECIMQQGAEATAGSAILGGFVSPIEAAVLKKLPVGEYEIIGRAAGDEFGVAPLIFNGSEEPAGPVVPVGPVAAVVKGDADFALANDVFGVYRRQAAEHGCHYIHPTYGTVSRYGLIPSAQSSDRIGIVSKNLDDGFALLKLIAGNDPEDGAMFPDKQYEYTRVDKKPKLGVPRKIIESAGCETARAIMDFVKNFDSVDMELKYFDAYGPVRYVLALAEISSNITRYDGVKFGLRAGGYDGVDGLYVKTRSEGFGIGAKTAAVLGTMALTKEYYDAYYLKAMKLRRLICDSVRFDDYDAILLPCAIDGGPYGNLPVHALADLAGLPSVSFSHGGAALQLVAGVKRENILYAACGTGVLT